MYRVSTLLTAVVATLAVVIAVPASAGIIAEYTFAGNSLAASTLDDHVTATSVASGNTAGSPDTINYNTTATYYQTSPSLKIVASQTQNGFEEYFSFAITPDAGKTLSLAALDYLYATNRGLATKVQVSIGGGTFTDIGGSEAIAGPAKKARSVDLSSLVFAVDQSAAFRIFGARTGGNTATDFYTDDYKVTGEVVPEPATLALLGAGGLMMIRRRCA